MLIIPTDVASFLVSGPFAHPTGTRALALDTKIGQILEGEEQLSQPPPGVLSKVISGVTANRDSSLLDVDRLGIAMRGHCKSPLISKSHKTLKYRNNTIFSAFF